MAGKAGESARALWDELRVLDDTTRRARIRGLRALRVDLAELLFEKSRTEGRDNRARGIATATLAVECLYPGGPALDHADPVELATLRARAWAWLANAHRLALDFIEAEKALAVARRTLPQDAGGEALAELLEIESGLRHFQGRFEEARQMLDHAAQSLPAGSPASRRARLLIQRGYIAIRMGHLDETIVDAQQALVRLSGDGEDRYLELIAYQHLILAHTRREDFVQAAQFLPAARSLTRELGARQVSAMLWRLEGLVWFGLGLEARALTALEQARGDLLAVGDRMQAALVFIDLAVIHAQRDDSDAAIRCCAEAIPLLQSYRAHGEILVVGQVLRRIVDQAEVQAKALRGLRARLDDAYAVPGLAGER